MATRCLRVSWGIHWDQLLVPAPPLLDVGVPLYECVFEWPEESVGCGEGEGKWLGLYSSRPHGVVVLLSPCWVYLSFHGSSRSKRAIIISITRIIEDAYSAYSAYSVSTEEKG